MRQTVAINDNGGEKRQKEFTMNETCMNHALNMPNIGCCPYCRIAVLEQKLADEQKAAGYWMEQSCKDHNRAEKAEKELSHYQGGVEVDGYRHCKHCGDLQDISSECQNCDTEDPPQRVRVLVMKEAE